MRKTIIILALVTLLAAMFAAPALATGSFNLSLPPEVVPTGAANPWFGWPTDGVNGIQTYFVGDYMLDSVAVVLEMPNRPPDAVLFAWQGDVNWGFNEYVLPGEAVESMWKDGKLTFAFEAIPVMAVNNKDPILLSECFNGAIYIRLAADVEENEALFATVTKAYITDKIDSAYPGGAFNPPSAGGGGGGSPKTGDNILVFVAICALVPAAGGILLIGRKIKEK